MTGYASVIIPVFNGEATLGDCLDGMCSQTAAESGFEIIVVDDSSKDGTVTLVEGFRPRAVANGIRLELIRQLRNRGPAAARNRGAEAARGEILLFTDADCRPVPEWVAEMTRPFRNRQVAAVKGAYRTRQHSLVARFAQAEFEDRYRMLSNAEQVDVVFTYACAVRRDVFFQVGAFDTGFPKADNEDTEFSWRLTEQKCRIVFNPKGIVYHRHPATLKDYMSKKVGRAMWRMYVYRRFPKKAVRDSYTPQTLKLQIGLVYAIALLAIASPFASAALPALGGATAALLATTLPFTFALGRDDPALKLAAPLLLVMRAVAMAVGLVLSVRLLAGRAGRAGKGTAGMGADAAE